MTKLLHRITRFFKKRSAAFGGQSFWEQYITDPRSPQGRRWSLRSLVQALYIGMLANLSSLESIEQFTEEMVDHGATQDFTRRVPDTTLYSFLATADPLDLRAALQDQVKQAMRRKATRPDALPIHRRPLKRHQRYTGTARRELEQTSMLPCGVAAIDGKTVLASKTKVDPECQEQNGTWNLRVVRAVLISSAAKLCLDQMAIPASTNDMGCFAQFFTDLMQAYGSSDLFEIVTADAGFCSLANASLVAQHDRAYVFRLKKNQPELRAEAERLRLYDQPLAAETHWEHEADHVVKRLFYRTRLTGGWLDWTHARQFWLVRKLIRNRTGQVTVEDHYFVTNLPWGRLNARECLLVTRLHWGIESDLFWTVDMTWEEDSGAWCRTGRGVLFLAYLRMLAYNDIRLLRHKHLRASHHRERTWEWYFDKIRDTFLYSMALASVGGEAKPRLDGA